jgi:hypothetical protein
MPGVVEVGDRFVGPIDGERVLDQIVRSDRGEVEVRRKLGRTSAAARHFDHAPSSTTP